MKHGLILGLILAVLGGLILHPDDFTPVMAVALFGGATLSAQWAYAHTIERLFSQWYFMR